MKTIDDVLGDVLGDNPWVRLGVSVAAGVLAGLAGPRALKSGARFALALGAKRLARYAFDVAFQAGHRDGVRLGGAGLDHAAERAY